MKFIVIPLEDAQQVFTEQELSFMRKSIDGSKLLVHEEILLDKRNSMGLQELTTEDGEIEWTYPVYEYESEELKELLNSSEWSTDEILRY